MFKSVLMRAHNSCGNSASDCLTSFQTVPIMNFFSEGIHQVTLGICGVTQEVPDLVSSITVASSSWRVHSCQCCSMATHAVHADTLTHAVSTAMLDETQMVDLETHPRYSSAFRVVLPSPARSDPHPPLAAKLSTTLLPTNIQKQYSCYMCDREALFEKKVAAYRRAEKEQLEKDSEKARQDSYVLLTLLHSLDRLHLPKSRVESSTRVQQPVVEGSRATDQDGVHAFSYTPALLDGVQPLSSSSAALLSQSASVPRFIRPPELPWDSTQVTNTDRPTRHDGADELNDEDIFLTGYGLCRDVQPPTREMELHSDDDLVSSDSELGEIVPAAATEEVAGPGPDDAYNIPGADPAADPNMPPLGKSVPINIPFHRRPVRRIEPEIEETEPSDRSGKTPAQMAASILALSRSLHSQYDYDPDAPRPRKSHIIDSPFF